MATTIKEFLVGLGFEVDEKQLNTFNSGLKRATVMASALGAAATVAAGFITSFVKSAADQLDDLGDAADRIGVASSELAEFEYIAKLTGSTTEAARSSMEGFSRVIGEAATGVGRGAATFEKLGLNAKDSSGQVKSVSQMMGEVRDKIKDLSKQEQVAILSKLGLDSTLIGAMTQDISALQQEFRQLSEGVGVDLNAATETAGKFNDSWDRMTSVVGVFAKSLALKLMPQIQNGMDRFRKSVVENAPKIINAILPIIELVLRVSEAFIKVVGRIGQGAIKLIEFFGKVNKATNGWAGYIVAAIAAWKLLNLSFLKSPLGMIVALGLAIALLVDDFMTWKEGGDSLIDWGKKFTTTTKVVIGVVGGLATAFVAITAATKAWALATTVINGVMKVARGVMLAFNLVMAANPIVLVVAAIAALIGAGYLLIKNWDKVKEFFSGLLDWFAEKFPLLSDIIAMPFKIAASVIEGVFEGLKQAFKSVSDFVSGGVDKIKNAAGFVSRVFGGGDSENPQQPAQPLSAPTPRVAAAMGNSQTVSQSNNIVINGATDPQATAIAVGGQQDRLNADLIRNLGGAVR